MKGSEKQIEWANQIKDKFLSNNQKLNEGTFSEDELKMKQEEDKFLNLIVKIEDSKFWIDEKGSLGSIDVDYEWMYNRAIKKGFINDK